jgi:diadenosine tetraphosphate (Ap4A) HIT family hydrolase
MMRPAPQLKVIGGTALPAKPCWFCLSSPDVEKHLVVAVGDAVYLAAPKGPLHDLHCILLPITHHTGPLAALPAEVAAEIAVFKARLRALYDAEGLAAVFYERCVGAGHHMHIQAVPVAPARAAGLRAALRAEGARVGITFTDGAPPEGGSSGESSKGSSGSIKGSSGSIKGSIKGSSGSSNSNGDTSAAAAGFLAFDLPDALPALHHAVPPGRRHPMQFARSALAAALGCPDRADWKLCAQGRELETVLARQFRAGLARFKGVQG